jgi:hypothetical protein
MMRHLGKVVVTLVAFLVAGCGSVQMSSRNPATLYTADLTASVFRLDHASTSNGTVAPTAISGPATLFAAINGMVVDAAADRLFVASGFTSAILVFDNASTRTGNVAPDRVVSGSATTLFAAPGPMVLDSSRDLLYVSNGIITAPSILIFSHASTMTGNVAPASTLTSPFIASTVAGLALDQVNDRLFVSSPNTHTVTCFDHASQLGSVPTGSRTISGPNTGLAAPQALALDKSGRLYVGNVLAGITVYAKAGEVSGDVAPTATIQGSSTQFHIPIHLAIDDTPGGTDSGDLYVQDFASGSGFTPTILVFTDVANLNGNVAPSGVLTFPNALGNALALDSTR